MSKCNEQLTGTYFEMEQIAKEKFIARVNRINALSNREKCEAIFFLEDEVAKKDTEIYNLKEENIYVNANKTNWKISCIGSLFVLAATTCASVTQLRAGNAHRVDNQKLEQNLADAVLSDEGHSVQVRQIFVNEMVNSTWQKDAKPVEIVTRTIERIERQRKRKEIAMADFQFRVITKDLMALADAAEKTQTSTQNFLKAISMYASDKPKQYANEKTPLVSSHQRIDNLLMKSNHMSKTNARD